jgi:RecA-family ATPase
MSGSYADQLVARWEAADPRDRKRAAKSNGHYKQRLEFVQFKDISLSTAPRYLMKGIIPSEGLVVVWGPPKCGKSFLVFDIVAHIAMGKEYRGRRVKQCPVLYFAFEGQTGFQARVEAFRAASMAIDLADIQA